MSLGKEKNHRGPLVSVIIPVYNTAPFLDEAVGSVAGQTLRDIEIICVNDGSTDESPAMLEKWAKADSRIRVITQENRGLSAARNVGLDAAKGRYVYFLDSDDWIKQNALEILYKACEKEALEVVFFCSEEVDGAEGKPTGFLNGPRKGGYYGVYKGMDLFSRMVDRDEWHAPVWMRMFSRDFLERTQIRFMEGILYEDVPFSIEVALKAQRAACRVDVLHARRRRTGSIMHSPIKDHNAVSCYKVYGFLKALYDRNKDSLKANEKHAFQKVLEESLKMTINLCCEAPHCLTDEVFWNAKEDSCFAKLMGGLAYRYWDKRSALVKEIGEAGAFAGRQQKIRTIAVHYTKMTLGGTERVVVEHLRLWMGLGYRVVLFTDEPPHEEDYSIPEGVKRVVLPPWEKDDDRSDYSRRAAVLIKALRDEEVDLMVYEVWMSTLLLWDLLVCKYVGVKFMVHCHGIFTLPLVDSLFILYDLAYCHSLADAVVTLTRTDASFWSCFNDTVFTVVNPLRFSSVSEIPRTEHRGKTVLWSQRFSPEKNPFDMIDIFSLVHAKDPEARLVMLGKAFYPNYEKEIKEYARQQGLSECVDFPGFVKNVEDYYAGADLSVITSEFEGFSLSLLESLGAGVPVVMYELPYLTIVEEGEGMISVANQDKERMAREILRLLEDPVERKRLGDAGRNYASKLLSYDYEGEWKKILDAVEEGRHEVKPVPVLWETLFSRLKKSVGSGSAVGIEDRKWRADDHGGAQIENKNNLILGNWMKSFEEACRLEGGVFFGNEKWKNKEKPTLVAHFDLDETGSSVALRPLCQSLKRNGKKVIYAAPVDGKMREKLVEEGFYVLVLPTLFQSNILRKFDKEFEFVVANTIHTYPIVAQLNGADVPVLWWVHESFASYEWIQASDMPHYLLSNVKVATVGPWAREALQQHRPHYHVEELIYGLPDLEKEPGVSEAGPWIPSDAEGKMVFALVGSLEPRKGIDRYLGAIERLPEQVKKGCLFLVVAGEYVGEVFFMIDKARKKHEGLISYIPGIEREDMPAFYRRIDCLVCASTDDPMPCVVTEACMFEKIVICSENTGYARLLDEYKAGIIYKNNSTGELADCIKRVYSGDESFESMKKNARRLYEERFSMRVFEDTFEREFFQKRSESWGRIEGEKAEDLLDVIEKLVEESVAEKEGPRQMITDFNYASLKQRYDGLKECYDVMSNSTCWRMTAPIRYCLDRIKEKAAQLKERRRS